MKDYTSKLLDKALDSIEGAEILLTNGKTEIAIGRAYYAMFYIAEALLNEKDLSFSKHGNVHAAYGEHFAKTKLLDPKFHRWLMDSFDARQIGDYGVDTGIETESALIVIDRAREFLATARSFLDKNLAEMWSSEPISDLRSLCDFGSLLSTTVLPGQGPIAKSLLAIQHWICYNSVVHMYGSGARMEIVIDASVLIAVITNEEDKPKLIKFTQKAELIAPLSVHWEMGNAFSAMLKRKRIMVDQAIAALEIYLQIPVRFVEVDLMDALRIANESDIYAYDAYLLACAEKYRSPLLSLDKKLIQCAKSRKLAVLELPE